MEIYLVTCQDNFRRTKDSGNSGNSGNNGARSVRNVKKILEAKIIRPLESAKCIHMILGMYLRNPKNGVQMYLKMYMLLPQHVVQISSTSPKRVCGGSHQLTSSKHPQLGINFIDCIVYGTCLPCLPCTIYNNWTRQNLMPSLACSIWVKFNLLHAGNWNKHDMHGYAAKARYLRAPQPVILFVVLLHIPPVLLLSF